MSRKTPTKSASELRAMIKEARRQIALIPGALQQQGRELRLQAQERRLGLRKP
jgi:hypothetical protein